MSNGPLASLLTRLGLGWVHENRSFVQIVFFISDLIGGGAERVTALLANYWAAEGRFVTVLTYAEKQPGEFELDARVNRISLGMPPGNKSLPGALVRNLRRVIALRRILRELRPDVAIGIQSLPSCLLALAGRPGGGVTIGAERIYPPSIPLGWLVSFLRKWTYGRLDAVVSQTDESAEWLQRHTNARRLPVIFNPLSVPLPRTSPVLDPAAILEPSTKTLLAAGRLVPQKGFDRLLRAFASVSPTHPEWRLVIAGIGSLRPELEALARELGIADKVKMLGRVGNMGDWYEAADAFALTSLFEGFPNVLCEAMAYGLACVSVDCQTGPRAILTDGHDGLLVKQDDQEALAAALDTVMGDALLRRRLGESASVIKSRLSLPEIAGKWESLFEELLERRSPRRPREAKRLTAGVDRLAPKPPARPGSRSAR